MEADDFGLSPSLQPNKMKLQISNFSHTVAVMIHLFIPLWVTLFICLPSYFFFLFLLCFQGKPIKAGWKETTCLGTEQNTDCPLSLADDIILVISLDKSRYFCWKISSLFLAPRQTQMVVLAPRGSHAVCVLYACATFLWHSSNRCLVM